MYHDDQLTLFSAKALTGTALSDHSIDVGGTQNDPSIGEGLAVVFVVTVAADHTTGDETYELDLVADSNADLSTATVLLQRVIAAAKLIAGSVHVLPIPPGILAGFEFFGIKAVLGGTTPTITLTAYVTPMDMIQRDSVNFKSGFTIL